MAYDKDMLKNMGAALGMDVEAKSPTESSAKPGAHKPAAKSSIPASASATRTEARAFKTQRKSSPKAKGAASLDDVLRHAAESRERKTRPVSITVKPSEYEAWKAAADSYDLSLSALIAIVMNDFVKGGEELS